MAKITRVELKMVGITPKSKRVDAIQSFVVQETPIVTLYDADGASGTGYSYTIGTGGPSIMALLEYTLAPLLIGRDATHIGSIWHDLLFATHSTAVGAITSLALAAIDTALWDLQCRKANLSLWQIAGGMRNKIPLYTTEGGWLHLSTQELVNDACKMHALGFKGAKIKIGKPSAHEDNERLAAVRAAVGDHFDIMVDANQGFTLSEALRRLPMLEKHNISWFEEPLPADDVHGHSQLSQNSSVPIAVGESLYSLSQFKDYLHSGAAAIVQVDVARIGGITPWLKVAHLSEAYNVVVCPHFLMELHLALVCAIPNAHWLEYIPQLDAITNAPIHIEQGYAYPNSAPGLGIDWNDTAIDSSTLFSADINESVV